MTFGRLVLHEDRPLTDVPARCALHPAALLKGGRDVRCACGIARVARDVFGVRDRHMPDGRADAKDGREQSFALRAVRRPIRSLSSRILESERGTRCQRDKNGTWDSRQ